MKDYQTAYWTRLLVDRASDLPLQRMLAWIQAESQGYPQSLGASTEVGLFQIDMQDGPAFGGSVETLHANFCEGRRRVRDLTDDEEALQIDTGANMVRAFYRDAQAKLAAQGASWSEDDVWCFTKLHHALPIIQRALVAAKGAGAAASWGDFKAYVNTLAGEDAAAAMNASTAQVNRYYAYEGTNAWNRYFDNAELVGYTSIVGMIGGGGLTATGKAVLALLALGGLMYYGGHYGISI